MEPGMWHMLAIYLKVVTGVVFVLVLFTSFTLRAFDTNNEQSKWRRKVFFSVIFNVLDDNDMHVYWRFLTSVDFPINVESRSMTTCNREGTKPRVRVLSPLCSLHSEETEWIASHRIAHHDSSVSYLRKFHSSPNIILRRPKSLVLLNPFLCDFCFFFFFGMKFHKSRLKALSSYSVSKRGFRKTFETCWERFGLFSQGSSSGRQRRCKIEFSCKTWTKVACASPWHDFSFFELFTKKSETLAMYATSSRNVLS